MAIDPLGSELSGRIKSQTVASGDGPAPTRVGARRTPHVTRDHVGISIAEHTLQRSGAHGATRKPSDPHPTEQMLEIGRRIAQNYYDRPEVQRVILEKLQREL